MLQILGGRERAVVTGISGDGFNNREPLVVEVTTEPQNQKTDDGKGKAIHTVRRNSGM